MDAIHHLCDHLNSPTKILSNKGTNEYLYDSNGTKVQKSVTEASRIIMTLYLGGFQYKDNVLQFFPHAEGYYDKVENRYVYNYTDHLGNIRVSYTQNKSTGALDILDESHYYPFGLKHSGYANNNLQKEYKYKYNGKELQNELDLNVYDYGARNYDLAIW